MNLKTAKAALLDSVQALSSCKWFFAKDHGYTHMLFDLKST